MTANLADRVEGLDGPCRETDALICATLRYSGEAESWALHYGTLPWVPDGDKVRLSKSRGAPAISPPPLTASLDAVVALVEKELPGACYQVGFVDPKHFASEEPYGAWARVMSAADDGHDDELCVEGAKTPALALLAAFLRARAALLRAKEADHG